MPDGGFKGGDFADCMEQVARRVLGEPNRQHSTRETLRWGTHGSLAVEIGGEKKGTWFDHEVNEGGGVLDLLRQRLRLQGADAFEWLRKEIGGAFAEASPFVRPQPFGIGAGQGRIVATYDYADADGITVFQVVRYAPKDFRQRRPDGKGGWVPNLKGVELVPYRLPELLAAPAVEPVFIPEGEKDVDALRALGLIATCNPAGANKWKASFAKWLRGRDVVVLPDNDDAGRSHADDVARKLAGAAGSIRVLALPSLPGKGDVSDWLAAGGTREELLRLAAEAPAADPAPPRPQPERDDDRGPPEDREGESVDLELTEDGVALAFEKRHRDGLRYCHDTGGWYVWQGTHWQPNRDGLAFTWARDLVRSLNRRAEFKTKAITGKAAFAGSVEKFAQRARAFAVTAETWDRDPFLLGTPGGVVDLQTGQLRPARQDDYITKLTACAPAVSADCPTWFAFLRQATAGDNNLVLFLQQWAGYVLTGSTREHALMFIYGPGGNGKSVFLNTVSRIMGDYCRTAPMDTFTSSQGDKHPTDLAMLRGARLVTATETEEGRAWAEARIKQMTGGDPVTARFMRQDFFTYTPQFKLMIAGNHKPALKNVDDAARRRFNIVPFLHKPEAPDRQLEAKLMDEAPGILRWMVEGCLDWQRSGLERPKIVTDATAEYFEAQDTIGRWLAERCILDPQLQEKPGTLLADCKAWAAENGEAPPAAQQFRSALEKVRGVRYATVKGSQSVKGIGLKPTPDRRQGGEGGGGWR